MLPPAIYLAKLASSLVKDKRFWKAVISCILILVTFSCLIIFVFTTIIGGGNSALADAAIAEYEYWQEHELSETEYYCQGEKYCSHFNYPVVDWCCIFVGYCADSADIDKAEIGYSINTGDWEDNLIANGDLQDPDTYQPKRGDVVLFDFSGRAHYDATGWTAHIGIVVEVLNDGSQIEVIAGNEQGDNNGHYASTSRVNRYTISATDNNIACYGSTGGETFTFATGLNSLVREVVTRNEVGVVYSELDTQYGTVVPNDNGAISIGVYCWHGDKARNLLQMANQNNPTQVRSICNSYGATGNRIYTDIVTGASWNHYIPDSYASRCISAILQSDSGRKAQDELSLQDAQKYIDICTEHGMTNDLAIAYCSDILNQWGDYSFDGGCLDGVTGGVTIDEVFNSRRAWSDSNYNYYGRRRWTYDYIKDHPITFNTSTPTESRR